MRKKINIILVDDHVILRSGLKMLIENEDDMKVVGEAGDSESALNIIRHVLVDVVVLDITLGNSNGIYLIKEIKKINPDIKILILTMHENEYYLKQAIKEKVSGYVLKKSADSELINAIRRVYKGDIFIDAYLTKFLVDDIDSTTKKLSVREQEVLGLLVKGYINKEIASHLNISVKTVETYRRRITEKLNIHSRYELLDYAIKKGILLIDK